VVTRKKIPKAFFKNVLKLLLDKRIPFLIFDELKHLRLYVKQSSRYYVYNPASLILSIEDLHQLATSESFNSATEKFKACVNQPNDRLHTFQLIANFFINHQKLFKQKWPEIIVLCQNHNGLNFDFDLLFRAIFAKVQVQSKLTTAVFCFKTLCGFSRYLDILMCYYIWYLKNPTMPIPTSIEDAKDNLKALLVDGTRDKQMKASHLFRATGLFEVASQSSEKVKFRRSLWFKNRMSLDDTIQRKQIDNTVLLKTVELLRPGHWELNLEFTGNNEVTVCESNSTNESKRARTERGSMEVKERVIETFLGTQTIFVKDDLLSYEILHDKLIKFLGRTNKESIAKVRKAFGINYYLFLEFIKALEDKYPGIEAFLDNYKNEENDADSLFSQSIETISCELKQNEEFNANGTIIDYAELMKIVPDDFVQSNIETFQQLPLTLEDLKSFSEQDIAECLIERMGCKKMNAMITARKIKRTIDQLGK
jgi:hypothetical protein